MASADLETLQADYKKLQDTGQMYKKSMKSAIQEKDKRLKDLDAEKQKLDSQVMEKTNELSAAKQRISEMELEVEKLNKVRSDLVADQQNSEEFGKIIDDAKAIQIHKAFEAAKKFFNSPQADCVNIALFS